MRAWILVFSSLLITDTLFQMVEDHVIVNQVEPLKVQGKREILQVYEVLGLA